MPVNPAKAGGPTTQISWRRGLHPAQPGDGTLCRLFDVTQFKNDWINFLPPLSLILPSYLQGACVHTHTDTHRHTDSQALGSHSEQEWEREAMQNSLSQKIFLQWSWSLWSRDYKRDMRLLSLCWSSRWSEPSNNIPYHSPALPSDLVLALLNLFRLLKHRLHFLALALLWWEHPSSLLFWWTLFPL